MGGMGEGVAELRPHMQKPRGARKEGSSARVRMDDVRSRLLQAGASAVGDEELIAVLLDTESANHSALPLAAELLAQQGGLKGLIQSEASQLLAVPRVNSRRAAQLLAAVELGRRLQRCRETRPRLLSPKEIHRYLAPELSARSKEVFHVLAFNTRNVLLGDVRVAEGTSSSCPVDPRAVFASALSLKASAIVVAHNHPSGDPNPSDEDISLTAQLALAGQALCVRVLDHLIVGDDSYVSLLERGLMPVREPLSRQAQWIACGVE